MLRALLILILTGCTLLADVGAPDGGNIGPDGYSVFIHFSGFPTAPAQTNDTVFNLGFTGLGLNRVMTNPQVILRGVSSNGYIGGGVLVSSVNYSTFVDNAYAQTYPNTNLYDATSDGAGGMTFRFHLDTVVMSNDVLTSLTLPQGFVSNSPAATITTTLTNSSIQGSPPTAAMWSCVPNQWVRSSTLRLSVVAFDWAAMNFQAVACVRFVNHDAHGHWATNFVNRPSVDRTFSYGPMNLHAGEWIGYCDVSGLTSGDIIGSDATCYKWRGTNNADSFLCVSNQPTFVLATISNRLDSALAFKMLSIYIDPTNGSDANGTIATNSFSLTQTAYLTMSNASRMAVKTNLAVNGLSNTEFCVFYQTNGTYWPTNFNPLYVGTNQGSWAVWTAAPGVDRSLVIWTNLSGNPTADTSKNSICISNLTISFNTAAATYVLRGLRYIWMANNFLKSAGSSSWGEGYVGYATGNCVNSNYSGVLFKATGTESNNWALVRGNVISNWSSSGQAVPFCFMENYGPFQIQMPVTYKAEPAIVYNNDFFNYTDVGSGPYVWSGPITNGVVFVNNIAEAAGTSPTSATVGIAADFGTNGTDSTNVLANHNTIVGAYGGGAGSRFNFMYNELTNQNPFRVLSQINGNIGSSSYIKTGWTRSPYDASRTNNFWNWWGGGMQGDYFLHVLGDGSFAPGWQGYHSTVDFAATNLQLTMKFASLGISNGGYGDYHLTTGPPTCQPTMLNDQLFSNEGLYIGADDNPGALLSQNPAKHGVMLCN